MGRQTRSLFWYSKPLKNSYNNSDLWQILHSQIQQTSRARTTAKNSHNKLRSLVATEIINHTMWLSRFMNVDCEENNGKLLVVYTEQWLHMKPRTTRLLYGIFRYGQQLWWLVGRGEPCVPSGELTTIHFKKKKPKFYYSCNWKQLPLWRWWSLHIWTCSTPPTFLQEAAPWVMDSEFPT